MSINLNRSIEIPVNDAEWEIDAQSAHLYYSRYMQDLAALKSGIPYADLGYSEKREASRAQLIDFDARTLGPARFSNGHSSPAKSIAVIKIKGAMMMDDGFSSQGMESVVNQINQIDQDPNIVGLVMDMDTGGGMSIAGTVVQTAIKEFSKPSIGFLKTCASAGLKAVLPCDLLIASAEEVRVGSVGTMSTIDKRALQYMQDNYLELYAKTSTNKNDEIRELKKGNTAPIVEALTKVNQFFLDQVAEYRDISGTKAMVDGVFTGKLLNAVEAYNVGLIDGIGSMRVVLEKMQGLISGNIPMRDKTANTANFFNQNRTEMNFKQFVGAIIPFINSKMGLAVPLEATAEEVLESLENAPGLTEVKAELQTIKDTLQQNADAIAQANATADEKEAPEGDTPAQSVDPMQTILAELQAMKASLVALQSDKTAMQQEVAKLKGAKADEQNGGSGKENSKGVNYATVTQFNRSLEVAGKSKY